MAYPTGLRGVLQEVTTWIAGGAVVVLTVYFADDLKELLADLRSDSAQASTTPNRSGSSSTTAVNSYDTNKVGGRRLFLRADRNNMFLANAYINGKPVEALVDTGATVVAIPYKAASDLGIRPQPHEFTVRTHTANGIAFNAPIRLRKVRIGGIEVRDVNALVASPGALHITLIGMEFLKHLKRVNIRGQELELIN